MYKKGSIVIWEVETPPPPKQDSTEEPTEVRYSVPYPVYVEACRADSGGLRPQDAAAEEANLSGSDAPRPSSSIPAGIKLRQRKKPAKPKQRLVVVHEDLINDAWWESGRGAGLLSG